MSQAEWTPDERLRQWLPARNEDGVDPLPGIVAVRYARALSDAEHLYRMGQPDKALPRLAMAARLAPHRALPHVLSAEIYLEAGSRLDALEAYERALQAEPTSEAASAGYQWLAHAESVQPTQPPAAAARSVATGGAVTVESAGTAGHSQSLTISQPAIVLVLYLLALAAAETAVTYVNPILVFPLHGGILAIGAGHVALLEQRASADRKARYLAAMILALMLAPLIRIISLTLPLTQIDAPYRYLFAGVPMVIGAGMVTRYIGLKPSWIGLVWRDTAWQIVAVEISVFAGFLEYAILRPAALGALPWTAAGALPALAVGLATGFPEELIFRGIMQTAARPLLGSAWSVVYVSLVFAALHIGYESAVDLAFVLVIGLLYGWLFERTRSIIGVSLGHGIANIVLFFVAPAFLGG
jgi:membrane protease YdiL (CAAX protease family)